jgi:hypothetical protein
MKAAMVRIEHAEPPASMNAVRRKIAGERLSQEDFHNIIKRYHRYTLFENRDLGFSRRFGTD